MTDALQMFLRVFGYNVKPPKCQFIIKAFGYNVKPSKCQHIMKENCRESAIKVFEDTNIPMLDGFRFLELVISTPSACDKSWKAKVKRQLPQQKIFLK